MDNQATGAKVRESAAASRAANVTLADFSEALSTGVLRAIDARKLDIDTKDRFKPWIWAGWWIGNQGPFDGGTFGPGGPGGPLG